MTAEHLPVQRLCYELLDSIKVIDARIDELHKIIKTDGREKRKELIERIEALIDTRFKLVYSFLDVSGNKSDSNPFNNMTVTYDMLKRYANK